MKQDRFDLEEKLVQAHSIIEDLKTLSNYAMENPHLVDADFISNALNGLVILQEARNDAAWNTFLNVFELDEYNSKINTEDNNDEEEYETRTSTK